MLTDCRCPNCGHSLAQTAQASRVAAQVTEWRVWCSQNGHWISADGSRVREVVAAMLLGCSEGHLANLRGEGKAPPHVPAGAGRGGVSYRLADLAEHLLADD